MSDAYLKDTVPLDQLQQELDDIVERYQGFYARKRDGPTRLQDVKSGRDIECTYMLGEDVGYGDMPRRRGPVVQSWFRFRWLDRQMERRVKKKGPIGLLEKALVHKIGKAFRTNPVNASLSAAFLASDVLLSVLDVIFAGLGTGWNMCLRVGKGLEVPVDVAILLGQETVLLAAEKGADFAVTTGDRQTGRAQYVVDEAEYQTVLTRRLTDLDAWEAHALFTALGRSFRFYIPKVYAHFGQCIQAYDDYYAMVFDGDEPQDLDTAPAARELEFATCDEAVEFTRRAYRLYHELYKLKRYLMPLLRFLSAVTAQAEVWRRYWEDERLWDLKPALAVLRGLDAQDHAGCVGTHLCYGRRKVFTDEEKQKHDFLTKKYV